MKAIGIQSAMAPVASPFADGFPPVRTWVEAGRVGDGIGLLEEYVAIPGAPILAWITLGELYREAGDYDKALALYERAESLFNETNEIALGKGLALEATGVYDEAIDSFLKALEANPKLAQGRYSLAHCLTAVGDLADSYAWHKQILQEEPSRLEYSLSLLKLDWVMGHPQRIEQLKQHTLAHPVKIGCAQVMMISPCAIQETGGGQHPVQVARAMAELGHQLLFVQLHNELPYSEPFAVLNHPFLDQFGPATPHQLEQFKEVLISAHPAPAQERIALLYQVSSYVLSLVPLLKELGYRVIYWCLDDLSVWGPSLRMELWQKTLLTEADVLLATATDLVRQLETLSHRPCHLIPNGFNRDLFQRERPPKPEALKLGEDKTFIYWGNLKGPWLDWDLLESIAKDHPQWTFNLIGDPPEGDERRIFLPNVHYLGPVLVEELYGYGMWSDVALIPFRNNAMTQTINPVKVYEYLACGLPVIAAPLKEMNGFPNVWPAETRAEFLQAMRAIDAGKRTGDERAACKAVDDFLVDKSWQARVQQFFQWVAQESSSLRAVGFKPRDGGE